MKKDLVKQTITTYEKTAQWYADTHTDIARVKPLADFFIKNLSGKHILEIGVGPGRDAQYFAEHGLRVTGIDLTKKFVEMTRRRVPAGTFEVMDMRTLTFPAQSFDGVWAMASFLHIPKKQALKTLQGFKKVLKPGGLIYISVKAGEGEKTVQKEYYQGSVKFFSFYSAKELGTLLSDCGFEVIKVHFDESTFGDPFISMFAYNG